MSLFRNLWSAITFLLSYTIRCSSQVEASSSDPTMGIICQGSLTVEPGPLIPMGSNLTIYCKTNQYHCNSRRFVELNGQEQVPVEILNCSTVRLRLTNLSKPHSTLVCKMEIYGGIQTICGLDLHPGYPPDEPSDISCEAPKDSDDIHCTWSRGRETHLVTNYSFIVSSVNRTQVFRRSIQGTGVFSFPRSELDKKEEYQLCIKAQNPLGVSGSKPFIFSVKDIEIPDPPHIVNLEFGNRSRSAVLHWNFSEYQEHLKSQVRLRTGNGSWLDQHKDLGRGLVRIEGLKPLKHYEIQIRVCFSPRKPTSAPSLGSTLSPTSPHRITPTLNPSSNQRLLCSKWNNSTRNITTPGIAPIKELDVWRVLSVPRGDRIKNVTVRWKPLSTDDYSGPVLHYELVCQNEGQRQEFTCPANVTQCSVQVSPGVHVLYVRVVTSYGTSPPATVHLTHTGVSRPVLSSLGPVNDTQDAVALSWSWNGSSEAGTEVLLGFVVLWKSGPLELGWQRVARFRNTTVITGLMPGVRYNVSLYAQTTCCVSWPSFGLVYSKEQKPVAVPKVSVLAHESRRVLIQWEELPVDHQRGILTHYNIYLKTLGSDKYDNLQLNVPGAVPSQRWLDCPEGAIAIQVSASTAAGEGPKGEWLPSQPTSTAVGLEAGVALLTIIIIIMMTMANLMCWSCVRKRIKQTCISLGPAWMSENLPKLGNSNAISLLKQGKPMRQTWSWMFTLSDPPLSPVEEVPPGEKDELYPIVHIERLQAGAGEAATEGTTQTELTATHGGNMGYKPQITTIAAQDKEVEENRRHILTCERTDRGPEIPQSLLGAWLHDVTVNITGISTGADPSSFKQLTSQCPPQISSLFSGDAWLNKISLEVVPISQDLTESQTVVDTASCLAMPMTTGYFPQTSDLHTTT